jgi:hypothetical protein
MVRAASAKGIYVGSTPISDSIFLQVAYIYIKDLLYDKTRITQIDP